MEQRWVSAENLKAILAELAQDGQLIAPVKIGDEVIFRKVSDVDKICADTEYVNSFVPPKDFFLPARQRLLRYELEDGVKSVEPEVEEIPEQVIFGIRSCDVAGIEYLTKFLSGEMFGRPDLADGLFMKRREKLTILSVVCQQPAETCMCVCCEGGPALESGFDWQLTRLMDGWLVEVGSEKGKMLVERFRQRLPLASEEAIAEKEERVKRVVANFHEFSPHRVQTMAASRMLSKGRLEHKFWQRIGERCIECGGCAFICPTCYCANIADLPVDGETMNGEQSNLVPLVPGAPSEVPMKGAWERIRCRDCCMLAGYVRHAGGIYPRRTTGERCLTRFFHKLSWQFHFRMGRLGCTGCGRCIVTCMGNIGISQVAEEMVEALTNVPAKRREIVLRTGHNSEP
ncbi:MAG: 4Fe-4S dicluster domain-containing protein [Armatimonadetes bacterium]|nr:4Fe-4S dicluster domain-containing protein [Armatimonadota bacterium]MDW8029164.1 4Fe-4S dicluster domain-containing protein [Armatimonadota bacterium]